MASSGSVFSSTLQTITTVKLEELDQQRKSFEQQYAALLNSAKAENDSLKRLFILVNGAKAALGVKTTTTRKNKDNGTMGRVVFGGTNNPRLEIDLKNLDRFLEQARYDPSVSPKVLEGWQDCIYQYLAVQSHKYQYADLYGKLVTEWLSSEKDAAADGDIEMAESFQEVPGAKKLEARTEWEKIVFEPAEVDTKALRDYLVNLFLKKGKNSVKALEQLREKVEHFENNLSGSTPFNVYTLRWVIGGLQSSDLLGNEKREVLKDFLTNEIILAEIADVLNMRMSALDRWTWGEHVPLEQRRKLNGTYSIHMHEDLLQAIFLHYIGVKWSVFFKNAFKDFRSNAWEWSYPTYSKFEREEQEYFLGSVTTDNMKYGTSLERKRAMIHGKSYFVHQLLDHETQQVEIQEGEEEAEFEEYATKASHSRKRSRQTAFQQVQQVQQANFQQYAGTHHHHAMSAAPAAVQRMATQVDSGSLKRRSAGATRDSDEDDGTTQHKRPMEVKQGLLHLLASEIVINTKLHDEVTCFHSVFDSWNPLLPHDTIIEVLSFFWVSEKWLKFFRTFLQAPLKFMDDGHDAQPRLRRRGTPGSHTLSDVFGETIFFCLDFAVNQNTRGSNLHRLYDDIWFWSPSYQKCVDAWASVSTFTSMMGVKLNETKSGSVRINVNDPSIDIDERLPEGEIRWGFLHLNPENGRFEIDKRMVDAHVEELRTQLQGKSKSVIDWIQAWNTYGATFFSSNFGKAANCFGREHVDMMLATHRHIQEQIFPEGSVVQFLKQTITERFGVTNIPDGFLFFPVELGGLDLKSPFVGLLQIREAVRENPYDIVDEFLEAEKEDYKALKQNFDSGNVVSQRYKEKYNCPPGTDANVFFSFERYTKYREQLPSIKTADLARTFKKLLQKPTEESIDVSVQVRNALDRLEGQANLKGITNNWTSMDAYWKWVAQMYGPEMVDTFGGLNVVDPGLLPIGMVSMFRQKRTKWQG